MRNTWPTTGLHYRLLLGTSITVLGLMSLSPEAALAAGGCVEMSGGVTIDGSGTANCADWKSGDLTVTSTGTINADLVGGGSTSDAISLSGNVGDLTVDGSVNGTQNNALRALGHSIGSILNNGTIEGSNNAIYLDANSSITSLVNNGTLKGSTYSIYTQNNTATIGSITNTGIIAGNIEYSATTGLTITGGATESDYGLLTGGDGTDKNNIGSVGNITHTGDNLTFDTGHIWLNDNINVGSNAVKVNTATVKLSNAVSITGDYTQTGGGLVSQVTSGSQYGKLNVSGTADISNTTLVLQGSNMASGTYTIVGAGTGNYAITSASVVGTSGATATVGTVGNDLVVTVTAGASSGSGKYTPKGNAEGGSAAPLGRVLDQLNGMSTPQAQAFQSEVLAAIDSLPSDQQGKAIKKLAPANAANTMQITSQSTSVVLDAVQARQQLVMGGDNGYYGSTGKAAGDGTTTRAVWGQILGGSASLDGNSENDGFSSKSFGLTSGIDHMISPNILVGGALSWLRSWTDGEDASSGSSQILDSYQLTLYGTYRLDRLAIDGQIGAGWNQFDQTRNIDFLGKTASADYNGQQYMARARVGYDLSVGGNTTLTPFTGLRWLHARNESYTETGADTANNSVNSLSNDSVTQELGATAAWQIDTDYGVLSPEISAAWVHDYTDSSVNSTGQIGGVAYSLETEGLPSDGARLGFALSLATFDTTDLRFEYDAELRSGYRSQIAALKANWRF